MPVKIIDTWPKKRKNQEMRKVSSFSHFLEKCMRRWCVLSVLFSLTFFAMDASAAVYKGGLGLRLEGGRDGNSGVSYKQFVRQNMAFEGLFLSDFDDGFEISALGMTQNGFPGAPSELMWYGGGGAHIGFWGDRNPFVAGIDGILGVEYAFRQIPLSLSLDWHPVFNLISKEDDRFFPMKFGLTVRYIF
jgi:hypothetical protein